MNSLSSGRQLLATSSALEWRDLESHLSLAARFEPFDTWLSEVFSCFFSRRRLATLQLLRGVPPKLQFEGLSETTRAWFDLEFTIENQQSRGALYHPTKEKMSVGWCNLGWYFSSISK